LQTITLDRFIEDEKDRKITEQVIRENFEIIKDIFYYLLSRSPSYPLIDVATLHAKLV
jgi:hypothetical protein